MTTMTISYDEKNVQIIDLIRKLIAAGAITYPEWEEWTEEEEKQAFLCTSRANAAKMFSKHLI
jgi:hypothetical protein